MQDDRLPLAPVVIGMLGAEVGRVGLISNIAILVCRTNTQYLYEDLIYFAMLLCRETLLACNIFHLTISAFAVNLDERIHVLDLNLDNDLLLRMLSSRSFHILGNWCSDMREVYVVRQFLVFLLLV